LCASDCSIELLEGANSVSIRVEQDLNNVLYVAINGDDDTAERGNHHCVFQTIEGAEAVALPGDLIYVHAGEYFPLGGLLGTDGVKVYCQPGVVVNCPGNLETLITDVGKGGIIYEWLGHATIICPEDAGRIVGLFEDGSNLIFEVDNVSDGSGNMDNGFVPGAAAILLNAPSSSASTDPTINPRNTIMVRFKEWVATNGSGSVFRVPFNGNGQSQIHVHGEYLHTFSRVITMEDRGIGYFHVDRVDVNSLDADDASFVARDVGKLFVHVDEVVANNTASNCPVIELGENDLIGTAYMEFHGKITCSLGSATGPVPNYGPIEIGGGTLIFKGSIDFTINAATVGAGAPLIRVRSSLVTNITNLDLEGSFCHNGGGLGATTTMRALFASGAGGGTNIIFRSTVWNLPDPAAVFAFNSIVAGMTLYPTQDVFTNSMALFLGGAPPPTIAMDVAGPAPMAAIRQVVTLPCF
jgi:hypothetical protein